jgi:hypothetical protein
MRQADGLCILHLAIMLLRLAQTIVCFDSAWSDFGTDAARADGLNANRCESVARLSTATSQLGRVAERVMPGRYVAGSLVASPGPTPRSSEMATFSITEISALRGRQRES